MKLFAEMINHLNKRWIINGLHWIPWFADILYVHKVHFCSLRSYNKGFNYDKCEPRMNKQ